MWISFEIFVCHGLNSSFAMLPTPFFSHPRPSVSFSNSLRGAGGCKGSRPSSDQASFGRGVEERARWGHTSRALSREGRALAHVWAGRGGGGVVLVFPGEDGRDSEGECNQ